LAEVQALPNFIVGPQATLGDARGLYGSAVALDFQTLMGDCSTHSPRWALSRSSPYGLLKAIRSEECSFIT